LIGESTPVADARGVNDGAFWNVPAIGVPLGGVVFDVVAGAVESDFG
jgi:hypothetical protein